MHRHDARHTAALLALGSLLSCGKDAGAPPALQGRLVVDTFPFQKAEGVAVSDTGTEQAFPVASDGTFAMSVVPGTYRVYFREAGTALLPGSRAALVYPRADGSTDRVVTVVANATGFDLGSVRYLGELPGTFHVSTRAAPRRYHEGGDGCEDGVDAEGQPCVDDHEGEDCRDGHDGGEQEGEHEDRDGGDCADHGDGGAGGTADGGVCEDQHRDDDRAGDDPHGDDDHHVCVPEHSPPHHIGCDDSEHDGDGGREREHSDGDDREGADGGEGNH
jgi:hypothetical protein